MFSVVFNVCSQPVSAFKPLGTSTASSGAGVACSRASTSAKRPSGGRVAPMPSSASMQKSCAPRPAGGASAKRTPASRARCQAAWASGGALAGSPSQVTTGFKPQACRCTAASSPSPPLLPGPQAIHTQRACGLMASASRATARPARCISVCAGRAAAAACSMRRVVAVSYSAAARWGVTGVGMAQPLCMRP